MVFTKVDPNNPNTDVITSIKFEHEVIENEKNQRSKLEFSNLYKSIFRRNSVFELGVDSQGNALNLFINKDARPTESLQGDIPIDVFLHPMINFLLGNYPLNVAVKEINNQGYSMSNQKMLNFIKRFDSIIEPIYALIDRLKYMKAEILFVDETFIKVVTKVLPNKKKIVQNCCILTQVVNDNGGIPVTILKFIPSRSKDAINQGMNIDTFKKLKSISTDRYAAYSSISKDNHLEQQLCFAHAARKIYEELDDVLCKVNDIFNQGNKDKLSEEDIDNKLQEYCSALPDDTKMLIELAYTISVLFECEQEVKSIRLNKLLLNNDMELSDEDKASLRHEIQLFRDKYEAPLINYIDKLVTDLLSLDLSENRRKQIAYYENKKEDFQTFLKNPDLDIDNNIAERSIKPAIQLRNVRSSHQSLDMLSISLKAISIVETFRAWGIENPKQAFESLVYKHYCNMFIHMLKAGTEAVYGSKKSLNNLQGEMYQFGLSTFVETYPIYQHTFNFLEEHKVYLPADFKDQELQAECVKVKDSKQKNIQIYENMREKRKNAFKQHRQKQEKVKKVA